MTTTTTASNQAPAVALTGVTGYLGGAVARELAGGGLPLRLLARRPEAVEPLRRSVVLPIAYANTQPVRDSLAGTRILFMVSAHESLTRVDEHRALIDAAAAAGVEHVVYTSFRGAAPDAVFTLGRDHGLTEAHLRASGMTWTFLRDNFYMDFFVSLCTEGGEIRGPAGGGACSAVTRADVAAVAAQVLRDPVHWAGHVLDLTGPQDLSMAEIAAAVGQHLVRDIPYINETIAEAYESRQAWPAEQWEYDAWVSTYTAIRDGHQAGVSGDVSRVLGRQPESLAQYLRRISL